MLFGTKYAVPRQIKPGILKLTIRRGQSCEEKRKRKKKAITVPVWWDSSVLPAGAAALCKANIAFTLCLPMLNLCSMANLFKTVPPLSL